MFEKIDVNGGSANDLYKYLTSLDAKPVGKGDISWNFEKFLLDRKGTWSLDFRHGPLRPTRN